jgi:hypothetical protein
VVLVPCLAVAAQDDGAPRLGHRLLDDYVAMVAARARHNTVLATAFDLKGFFTVVGKDPAEVTDTDVLSFIRAQREPRRGVEVVRIEDGEAGLSAHHQAAPGLGDRPVRVSGDARRSREESCAAWVVDTRPESDRAADPDSADIAAGD